MDNAIIRMRRGQAAAAVRVRELEREEGPKPEQAVAEALAAIEALSRRGAWPAPRDAVDERSIKEVRRRWARIQRRAQKSQTR